jgi:hypothetical protein
MNIKEYKNIFRIDKLNKYDKYISMFSKELLEQDIKNVLPDHLREVFSNDLIKFNEAIQVRDIKLYKDIFDSHKVMLSSLDKAFIDVKAYNLLLATEKNETIRSILKSFRCDKNGLANTVKYKLVSTTTGRLVCSSNSPSILTLPKRCRKIFGSRWKSEGELLMIDFSSLEPRIAKKLTSKENYVDIYEKIKSLLQENLDRSVIKRAVISTLYGSNTGLDNISKEKTDLLMKTCKDFFEYDKLIDIAKNETEWGFRMNYFGRPIWNTEERKDAVVINNYIQSTAVDVSLMYFNKLISTVDTDVCKPLFVIHDAVVFDVHNDYKNNLVNLVKKGYNCSDLGYFPLEITNFMETK